MKKLKKIGKLKLFYDFQHDKIINNNQRIKIVFIEIVKWMKLLQYEEKQLYLFIIK